MFPITVTICNPAQLSAVMAALNVDQIDVTPKAAAKVEKPAPAKTEAAAPATKAEPIKTEAAADKPAVTYDEVKKATQELAKTKGRDAVVKVLGEFKVATAMELKPEQYAAYLDNALKAAA